MRTEAKATQAVGPRGAVVAERVSKIYRRGNVAVHALRDASLGVREGEFVAVMGPSGSGKSTLLHLVAGLDTPSSGSISVGGQLVSAMDDDEATVFRRRHIGYIYQHFNFLPDLTVEQNVGIPVVLDGWPEGTVHERVAAVLEQVGLYERRQHLASEMSGGELQRTAIARALVAEPELLLADEPTGNLDSLAGERVLMDMRRAADEVGRTIILVTHDPKAAAYADRIERLLDGSFQSD